MYVYCWDSAQLQPQIFSLLPNLIIKNNVS